MFNARQAKQITINSLDDTFTEILSKIREAAYKGHADVVFDFDISSLKGGYGAFITVMNHLQHSLGFNISLRKGKLSHIRELRIDWIQDIKP